MHSEGLDLEGEGFSSRLPKGGESERESLIDFVYGYIASPPLPCLGCVLATGGVTGKRHWEMYCD